MSLFIEKNRVAINDLVDKIAGEVMAKLPCLSLGNQQEVRKRLHALVEQAETAKIAGGKIRTGAWETDGTFVVMVSDSHGTDGVRIVIALALGEMYIQP